jgi:HEAT repeat protein
MSVLARLFSRDAAFDRVIEVLRKRKAQALPALVRLLKHPDPSWRTVAAAALGRVRETPRSALPALLDLLSSPDASAKVAAISAIECLPPRARDRAVPAIADLLNCRRVPGPAFTHGRAHVPRGAAAHFLGTHGGARGMAVLQRAARRRKDPVIHHIDDALERAGARPSRSHVPSNRRSGRTANATIRPPRVKRRH